MTFKNQLKKLKENWLIIAIVVVAFMFLNTGSVLTGSMEKMSYAASDSAVGAIYSRSPYYYEEDFEPDAEERIVTRNANVATSVEHGKFQESHSLVLSVITSNEGILLNQNVNNYGTKRQSNYHASYTIKVEESKLDSAVDQLKAVGEVTSFSVSAQDITGSYTNTQIELDVENSRLERYQSMYDGAVDIKDKIELNDRIFDQERKIKYIEDRLENMDQRVDYSTIYMSLNEKPHPYADLGLVKFSQLVSNFVSSFNGMLHLIALILPWAIVAGVIYWVKKFRKK